MSNESIEKRLENIEKNSEDHEKQLKKLIYGENKCSLCSRPLMEGEGRTFRLMNNGDQLWFKFCEGCYIEAIDKQGMKICFRDEQLMAKPGITKKEIIEICDHTADTYDY